MDAIAVFVEDVWFGAPDWAAASFIFGGLYLLIGLLVRSWAVAAMLGALAGLVVLSLLFHDFMLFEEISPSMMGLCAAYGAVFAGLTAVLRGWAWKRLAKTRRVPMGAVMA